MDKFRIRGGDFIGIIIPGIFLLTNLYLVFHDHFEIFLKNLLGSQKYAIQENVIIFIVFIVLSYTIGVSLRLFSPDIPDNLSGFMGRRLRELFKRGAQQEYEQSALSLPDNFPYFNWVMEFARYNWPNIKSIFDEYLCYLDENIRDRITKKDEDLEKIASIKSSNIKMYDKSFLNYCKLFVMHHSPALGDEILFAEGMSRMLSGLFYATLLSMTIIVGNVIAFYCSKPLILKQSILLFLLNAILISIVTINFRKLRRKEVLIIFGSYGIILYTLKIDKIESPKQMINPPPHKSDIEK